MNRMPQFGNLEMLDILAGPFIYNSAVKEKSKYLPVPDSEYESWVRRYNCVRINIKASCKM